MLDRSAFEHIVNNLHDGLYFVDRDRTITYWNRAAEQITGFTAAEVIGRSCSEHVLTHVDASGRDLCRGLCPLAATIRDGMARQSEIYLHHKDGHRVPVSVRVTTLIDGNGAVIGGIELFTDISDQTANTLKVQELERLAMLDNLTQLANRNYIEHDLNVRLEEKRRLNVPFGILFIDIDHFKRFNDTYGHDVGDRVLKFVAGTFTSNARAFDLYGRWGGEEFIGIIRNVTAPELEMLGDRLRMLVEKAYLIHNGAELRVTISLGATVVSDDDTAESVIKRADTLLYASKAAGRNRLSLG